MRLFLIIDIMSLLEVLELAYFCEEARSKLGELSVDHAIDKYLGSLLNIFEIFPRTSLICQN